MHGPGGGGLVAAIDGMRLVVPVPSVYARPNRKYFGPKRGVTWLNMVNDQAAGLGAKVVSGTARDSLHMIDVIFAQDGGRRPEIIVADTGSYSDVVFGLVHLLGMEYRPALADLPDQKLWRVDPAADHGPLNTAARGRIDLARVRRHWDDILRVVASVHTGAVFHGKNGELYQHYYKGMEDQLGALGLVLNCVVLWTTRYQDAALAQLRAAGYPVADDDVARLSPFVRRHLNVHGKYSFSLPELAGGLRTLRDPDAPDDEED